MKAACLTRYGPPEAVEIREVERPVPGDDDSSSLARGEGVREREECGPLRPVSERHVRSRSADPFKCSIGSVPQLANEFLIGAVQRHDYLAASSLDHISSECGTVVRQNLPVPDVRHVTHELLI